MPAAVLSRTSQTGVTPEGVFATQDLIDCVYSPVKSKDEVTEVSLAETIHWTMARPFVASGRHKMKFAQIVCLCCAATGGDRRRKEIADPHQRIFLLNTSKEQIVQHELLIIDVIGVCDDPHAP